MSSFSNTTTRIIDPVFQTDNRVEFRLPADSLFLSNMRLLGVGASTSNGGTAYYNPLVGGAAVIRSIGLFDGNQLLDQLANAQMVLALKAAQTDNDENISQARRLAYNRLGYVASGEYDTDAGKFKADGIQVRTRVPIDDTTGQSTHINLRTLLSFLSSSMILPTNVFRQLRLVIEYQSSDFIKSNVWNENNGTNEKPLGGCLLVVDEANDGDSKTALMSGYQGISFNPLEVDVVHVPATAAGADTPGGIQVPQTNNFLVHGFNNKYLNRIAIMQRPIDKANWTDGTANVGYAGFSSVAQWRSALQVRVNGANKLAGDGIAGSTSGNATPSVQGGSRANRTLRKLTDAWGSFNVVPTQNMVNTQARADVVDVEGMQDLDMFGLRIDSQINELQIRYDRQGVHGNNAAQRQALALTIIGEVRKAVVMNKNGTYNVVYN
jgi:hypothetical protein